MRGLRPEPGRRDGARQGRRDRRWARWRIWSRSSTQPRAVWVMLPAGAITEATVNDAGRAAWSRATSSSTAATPTTRTTSGARRRCATKGIHYRRCRHQRRRVGARARLLHDDRRRRSRRSSISTRSSRRWRPGSAPSSARRAATAATARRAGLSSTAGPAGAGHFVKMVHNGIEYGMMQAYAEGFDILHNASSDELPEDERYTLEPGRHRRGVAARQRRSRPGCWT